PPDPVLMEKYVHLLEDLRKQCEKLVVVVGGGSVARDFIRVAEGMGLSEWDKDEVAISVSRLIAQLLARRLGDLASRVVPTSIDEALRSLGRGEIVVMGGLKPGMTTDAVAAMIAERIGADLLVKATDQDGIYDKDPRKRPEAKKIDALSFDNLFQLFEENKHKAGIHQVLDPEAVRILQRGRTTTIIVNGFNPENVVLAVRGEKIGTVIQ
ncbi:MAG: UMP kinase, partial [Candidatus Bathyarchaeia archaeon]